MCKEVLHTSRSAWVPHMLHLSQKTFCAIMHTCTKSEKALVHFLLKELPQNVHWKSIIALF